MIFRLSPHDKECELNFHIYRSTFSQSLSMNLTSDV